MTNPRIPPASPPTQTASQKPPVIAPAAPVVALRAPVREAPEHLRHPEKPVQVEGRVVSSNAAAGETRIATAEGEIVIQTEAAFSPGAAVSVEVYLDKAQVLANIALLKKQAGAGTDAAKAAEPLPEPRSLPPLKTGSGIIALKLADELAPPSQQKTEGSVAEDPALREAARVILQVKESGAGKFPAPLLLPLSAVAQIVTSSDVFAALQKLPADQREKIVSYLNLPIVTVYLKSLGISPPQPPDAAESMATPAASGHLPLPKTAEETDLFGAVPFDIARAQATAKLSPQAAPETHSQQTPGKNSLPPPVLAALSSLTPFVENLGSITAPLPAYIRQFVPAQALAQMNEAGGTLHNFFFLTVRQVFPPGAPVEKAPLSPPSQAPADTPPPSPFSALTGTVEALTSEGHPIVRTEMNGASAHLVFKTPVQAAPGTVIIFDAQPMTPEQVMGFSVAEGNSRTAAEFRPQSMEWPALQETMQALSLVQPSVAQNIKNALPAPAPRLAPAALFFLAALRMGSVESWIGNAALQGLRDAGKRDLVERLARDFSRMSAQSKETVTGDWRAISMPILHDDHLSQMHFFVRRQQDGESGEEKEARSVTRFLLNLHLSRMGEMQLDGLLRRKSLDLILRSEEPLPAAMRQDLMRAFAKGLTQAEMQGGISFQARREHWVTVEPAAPAGTDV